MLNGLPEERKTIIIKAFGQILEGKPLSSSLEAENYDLSNHRPYHHQNQQHLFVPSQSFSPCFSDAFNPFPVPRLVFTVFGKFLSLTQDLMQNEENSKKMTGLKRKLKRGEDISSSKRGEVGSSKRGEDISSKSREVGSSKSREVGSSKSEEVSNESKSIDKVKERVLLAQSKKEYQLAIEELNQMLASFISDLQGDPLFLWIITKRAECYYEISEFDFAIRDIDVLQRNNWFSLPTLIDCNYDFKVDLMKALVIRSVSLLASLAQENASIQGEAEEGHLNHYKEQVHYVTVAIKDIWYLSVKLGFGDFFDRNEKVLNDERVNERVNERLVNERVNERVVNERLVNERVNERLVHERVNERVNERLVHERVNERVNERLVNERVNVKGIGASLHSILETAYNNWLLKFVDINAFARKQQDEFKLLNVLSSLESNPSWLNEYQLQEIFDDSDNSDDPETGNNYADENIEKKYIKCQKTLKFHEAVRLEINANEGRFLCLGGPELEPGSNLIVESPFISIPNISASRTRDQIGLCWNCRMTCYNAIPCCHCDSALFCSQKCLEESNGKGSLRYGESYSMHRIFCGLDDWASKIPVYGVLGLCMYLKMKSLCKGKGKELDSFYPGRKHSKHQQDYTTTTFISCSYNGWKKSPSISFASSFESSFASSHQPSFESSHQSSFESSHQSSFESSHQPSFESSSSPSFSYSSSEKRTKYDDSGKLEMLERGKRIESFMESLVLDDILNHNQGNLYYYTLNDRKSPAYLMGIQSFITNPGAIFDACMLSVNLCSQMADECNLSLEMDGPFLMQCILQCRANAFTNTVTVMSSNRDDCGGAVEVVDRVSIGSSLYLCSSFLNHSCRPNVFCKFMGNDIIATATRSISSGEKITISYGPQAGKDAYERRQHFLTQRYGFKCECDSCLETERTSLESLDHDFIITCQMCSHANRTRGLCMNILKCSNCNFEIPLKTHEMKWNESLVWEEKGDHLLFDALEPLSAAAFYERALKCREDSGSSDYMVKAKDPIAKSPKFATECVSKSNPKLANLSRAKIMDKIARAYTNAGQYSKAIPFCKSSCEIVSGLFGSFSPEYLQELLKYAQLLFNDRQAEESLILVEELISKGSRIFGLQWSELDNLKQMHTILLRVCRQG